MRLAPLFAFVVSILAIFYGLYKNNQEKNRAIKEIISTSKVQKRSFKNKLEYIIYVIKNGSNHLNFPASPMEGGYITNEEDIKDVACFVLELSNQKCKFNYNKTKAQGLFSSNCAGCHGNNGKGLNGSSPDLTKKDLLGMN
ncbi:MAG: hypothetical protein GXO02_04950 [Epsilonproteobacteria bacterium]|nr:hypothetical protein [Campylobacterota bacterium]